MTESPADLQLQRHDATVIEALGLDDRGENPDVLFAAVYDQLRRLAQWELARLRPGQTLQATALVHDAWLRIAGADRSRRDSNANDPLRSRGYFFGAAVRAMRRILVEQARAKATQKRGGSGARVEDDPQSLPAAVTTPVDDMISLDDALRAFEGEHERAARVVHLRFFGGLSHDEIAALLAVSVPTVERDWRFARSWLQSRMRQEFPDAGS